MATAGNTQQTDVIWFMDESAVDSVAGAGKVLLGFDHGGRVSFGLGSKTMAFQSEVYK